MPAAGGFHSETAVIYLQHMAMVLPQPYTVLPSKPTGHCNAIRQTLILNDGI